MTPYYNNTEWLMRVTNVYLKSDNVSPEIKQRLLSTIKEIIKIKITFLTQLLDLLP